MKLNWNSKISACVTSHIETLLQSEQAMPDEELTLCRREERRFARLKNVLPVYSDMTGSLGFSPDGVILFSDWESNEVKPMTDEGWQIIAAVSAIERYPDLREILPDRPNRAKSCDACGGKGRMLSVFCGRCHGLGWIP
jgi:hypothetical protein